MKHSPIVKFFLSYRLTVVCLVLLFGLTVWGTLYQVGNGLHVTKEKFFNSWFFLAFDFLPLPGARLVLWVSFVNLVFATLLRFRYTPARAGLVLTHLGIYVLLFGSAYTLHFAQESYLTLEEGQALNVATDYHHWELSLWTQKPGGDTLRKEVIGYDVRQLKKGVKLGVPGTGLQLEVVEKFPHCAPLKNPPHNGEPRPRSASGITSLVPKPAHADPAKNMPGLICNLTMLTPDPPPPSTHLLFGGEQQPLRVSSLEGSMFAQLRRKRHALPLLVKLLDFKKTEYPGTRMAKSFESRVQINSTGLEREAVISMNKPLRFQDFTLYQSSYSQAGQKESSTFSVVRNRGRLLPYIGSLVISIGMLLHFTLRMFSFTSRIRKPV